jgi:CheY-like chemotaxis protein
MPRVLIVEDEPGFRTLLETMVRLEGYDVHLAADGDAGLAKAREKIPDIVMSDIEMPGIRGLELVRRLKADPATRNAYVILVTGQGTQDSKLDALRAGADDFLEKPSSRQEILGRLEIAQKVLAVQGQQREAEARAKALEDLPAKVRTALDGLDRALAAADEAIAKKNGAALAHAVKAAKEAAAKARAACPGDAAPSEGSWL